MSSTTRIRKATSSDIQRICEIDTNASANFASIPAFQDLVEGSHGCLEASSVEEWLSEGIIYVIENVTYILGITAVQLRDGRLGLLQFARQKASQPESSLQAQVSLSDSYCTLSARNPSL